MQRSLRRGTTRIQVTAVVLVLTMLVISASRVPPPVSAQTSGPITEQWVDQQLVNWKPSTISPMNFGAILTRASYDNIEYSYNTAEVENADLAMLLNTNASSIRIDIGYDAWLKNDTGAQQEMASLVSQIRAAGRQLVIADASAESYRGSGQIPWSQFKQAWIARVQNLASLYHPDYYIVIKEPGWYVPMISDALTNPAVMDLNDWLNLTQTLVSTVHAVSPATQVGVAIGADSLANSPSLYIPYMQEVTKITGLSFIGFDIYTITGFEQTQSFLSQYGSGGKAVWIAECWSGDGSQIFDSSRATLDANWIKVVYYFGEQIHATAMFPFYTDLFASYGLTNTSPTDSSQIISTYQQRTPVFYAYQSLASGNGSSTTQTTTTSVSTGSSLSSVSTSSSFGSTSTGSGSTSETSSTSQQGGFLKRDTLLAVGAFAVLAVVVIAAGLYLTRKRRQ